MYDNNVEINLVIKKRPITEYTYHGQVWVEGRGGSEYEIEVKNKTNGRIEAVISVDGLSIIDGKMAGHASSGYLLNSQETIRIPGWKVDNNGSAKFAFSGKGESYATEMTGDARNNGIIGIKVFAEKYQKTTYRHPYGQDQIWGPSSVQPLYGSSDKYLRSFGLSNMSATIQTSGSDFSVEEASAQQNLGTSFGDYVDFSTHEVSFDRGDMLSMMVMQYDDARGLKARGIIIERPSKQKYQTEPSAFPADEPTGCAPPKTWKRRQSVKKYKEK